MKINRKTNKTAMPWYDVDIGETFVIESLDPVFLKIIEVLEEETGDRFNAVNLSTGELDHFQEDCYVHCVTSKLTVEE